MKIHEIETELFKLDGGAMFGVVPKSLWNRLNPADENNLCTWAMRCLLVEDGEKKILIDTGLGNKQSEKFFSHFQPHGAHTLLSSLAAKGFKPEDITDVIITHLHFDHVGGAVMKTEDGQLKPQFPNATYWSSEKHWNWALEPNSRERASFLKENFVPLDEAGQLQFIDPKKSEGVFTNLSFIFSHGHTEEMMSPVIHNGDKQIVFAADLMPSSMHLHMPYVMAYDIRPLVTLEQKKKFLNRAVSEEMILYFEHDPVVHSGTVGKSDRGKFVLDTSDLPLN